MTGLKSGSGYYIAVRALNRAGWSDLSPYLEIIAGRLPSPPPRAPQLIKSFANQIKFQWQPSTDVGGASKIDSYNIYVDGIGKIDTVSPQTLQYTYTGVTEGQSYLISISAVSGIGEGPKSLDSIYWAIDTPSAPTLSIVETTRDSCTVSWNAVTPPNYSLITGYVLLIDDGLGGEFKVAYDGSINPTLQKYSVENLRSQTTYRLMIYALNKAGAGTNSTIISCYTATKPGQPGRPKMVTSSDTHIELVWDPAYDDGGSPIQQYQLFMDEVEGLGQANIENWVLVLAGQSLTYTVNSGLKPKYSYRFKVLAMSEQSILSQYSEISEYIAASLPQKIQFPATPFPVLK